MSLKPVNLRVFLVMLVLLTAARLTAQPGVGISYSVSQPQMPMPTLSAATAMFTATDETLSTVLKPAGFLFTYGGRPYDGFVVSSNGWLALVPQGQATVPGLTAGPTNNLANHPASVGASVPIIAPLWDNLKSTSLYTYAGGILTVRWTAVAWDAANASATTSFGVQLNTATSGIKFVYTTVLSPTNASASIGITGPCAGDYYSWKSATDYTYSPSVPGTAGSNTLTLGTAAGLAIGNLLIPTTPLLTATAASTNVNTLTFSTTAALAVGMFVSGPGIPPGTTVASIVSATQITVSNNVTVAVGNQLVFSYFPPGTTVTGISGTTVTFSNPLAAACTTTATFRFITSTVDSVQEFNTIGGASPRPASFYLDWTPSTPWNDNCNATPVTIGGRTNNLGSISSSTCTPITWATTHATASATGAMCGGASNDVWFVVTKPTGVGSFIIRTTASTCGLSASVAGTQVEVFSGTCGALVSQGCSSVGISGSGTFGEVAVSGNACASATYLVRVAGDNNESGKFDICAIADASAGSTCASAISVPSIPQTYSCVSTAGAVNDYSANGCNAGYNGEDLVYTYTPSSSGCINVTTTGGTGTNAGIFVFDGCPGTGTCVGFATSATSAVSLNNLSLAGGTTYYFVIDNQSGALNNITVNFTASTSPVPANDNPAGATPVTIFPSCTNVAGSTFCASPTPASASAAVDVWFSITVPVSGAVTINTSAGAAPSMADPALAVYATSCTGPILGCNDDLTGTFPGLTLTGLMPSSTIFVRVWAKPGTSLGNFNICATSCSPPASDNCSNAINLGTPSAGVCNSASSSTACSGGSATPAAPACGNYAGGDVWFRATAPANGILNVSISPGTTGTPLNNPAFAVYSGSSCGALTLVSCTDQSSGSFNNLTVGGSYYIRVWSEAGSTQGTFDICASTSCVSNDECYSATALTVSNAPAYISGTNLCATTSCGIPYPTCANFATGIGTSLVLNGGTGYGASQTYTGVQVTGFGAGTGALATITTNAAGAISSVTITNGGTGYFPNNPATPSCVSGGLATGTGTPALPAGSGAVISYGATTGHNDVWYTAVVPASGGLVITMLTGTLTDPVMQVYTGGCGSLSTLRCDDDAGPGLASEVSWCAGQLTPGQTVYIRIWPYSRFTSDGTFQITAYDPGTSAAVNPYQTDNPCDITTNFPVTFGSCTNYTYMSLRCSTPTTNANFPGIPNPFQCWPLGNGSFGSDGWSPSNDIWVRVVVPTGVTGMNFLTQSGTEYDDNMAVYRVTSPCNATGQISLSQLGCDDLNGPGLMPYLSLGGLVPGETLYVRHYPWFGGTIRQGDFYFCVEAACTTSVPNDDPCVALPLTVNSGCIYSGPYTTSCASVTSQTGLNNPTCGGFTTAGTGMTRDVWFTATVPASGQVTIDVQSVNIADAAMAVYTAASCSTGTVFTQVGCDDNSSANPAMPYLSLSGLTPGATIYIRVWGRNGGTGQFLVCLNDPCPLGPPPNDDPCNYIQMTIGTTYTGYNSCATGTNDPAAMPACFTLGTANTVWYRFTAPSSSVNITTTLGSLTNTQIALYQGGFCFSLIAVSGACNDNYSQCGVPTLASQIIATGLSPGTNYYIMLDGYGNQTGTFGITVYDASATLPATPQQDCPLATVICAPQTVFGSPGFIGAGNYCDLGAGGTAYGCVPATGRRENNSAWFAFTIDTTGVLSFDINPSLSNANYDWVLWNITGQTAPNGGPNGTICQAITANTATIAACNYDSSGTVSSTGMSNSGTCLQCGAGQGTYASSLPVTAGETYLLMINNTSGTAAGFTLDFSNTPVVQYVSANPLNWSGGANTSWTTPTNWGGCGSPDCAIGANILPGLNQPVIAGTETVKDVIINPGASLTLLAGATLNVCGNFINNGTLNANPTSTVRFIGTGAQTISGNITGISRFGHMVVDKVSGQVNMNANVDVGGDFTTVNGTSILNLNNKTLKLFKNFNNANGNTTIIGVGSGGAGSTVEFAGNTNQVFTNLGSNLVLNNITINQPIPGFTVTLAANPTSNLMSGTGGQILFTSGRFITGTANEVVAMNTAAAGASVGNTNSYVDGWLRRYFGTSAITYEFAVGNSLYGYERASMKFTTGPSSAYNLRMRFLSWGGSNLPLVPGVYPPLECANYDWSLKNALNHGYWNTEASTATPTGVYDLELWNRSYTNYTGTTSTSYPSTGQTGLSNVIPMSNTAGLTVGMNVLGPGIPAGATLSAIAANTSITISLPTVDTVMPGDYINFFTSGPTGRFDALTIMKDTTAFPGTGGWKMEAICPCNNTYPPPAKPVSKRYGINATTSGFSNFATVQFGTALPIELISFDAEQAEGGNLCKWSTASETDNNYFDLERSYDGETFTSIATIDGFGPGTTSMTRNYSFLDKDPCNGIVYYRLRQVDINGVESYSDVVVLNCIRSKGDLVLFPNPASEKITYSFFENTDGILDIDLIDVLGNIVKSERFSVQDGYNSLRTSVTDLSPGIYFLRLQRMDRTGDARMVRFTKQ
jgi:hypothetical protein